MLKTASEYRRIAAESENTQTNKEIDEAVKYLSVLIGETCQTGKCQLSMILEKVTRFPRTTTPVHSLLYKHHEKIEEILRQKGFKSEYKKVRPTYGSDQSEYDGWEISWEQPTTSQ